MSINWNFNSEDYEEQSFKPIPAGDHRVRIASAEEKMSINNNQMIVLTLDVSGYNSKIWHNVTLLLNNQKFTNQKLGELWNSFGIPQGDFNLNNWKGKVGAAKVKHEDYNGEPTAKIAYFINKDKQNKLPPWDEPSNKAMTGSDLFEIPVAKAPWE